MAIRLTADLPVPSIDQTEERPPLQKEECFRRAKATSTQYGIWGKLKYKCVLPLKRSVFGLTEKEQARLTLYHDYLALWQKGIQTVELAFSKYQSSTTNRVEDAKTFIVNDLHQSKALVESYDALVAMAVGQASQHHSSEKEYLYDLRKALAQRGKGWVFLAMVNQARAKLALDQGSKITGAEYLSVACSSPHEFLPLTEDSSLSSTHEANSDSLDDDDFFEIEVSSYDEEFPETI